MDLKPIKSDQSSIFQNDRVSALLSDFLSRRSERTRVAYDGDLTAFAASTGQPSSLAAVCFLLSLPAGEANGAVLRYRSEMIATGLSSATVNRRLAAVRSVVKLARTLGLVSWSIEISGESARAYGIPAGRDGAASSGFFPSCRLARGRNREKQYKNSLKTVFPKNQKNGLENSPETVFGRKQKISLKTVYQGDGSNQEISPETVSRWKRRKQKNSLKTVFRRKQKNRETACFSLIGSESRRSGI